MSYPFAQASDPRIKWEVLETDHFQIIYDQRYPEAAREYAVASEVARTRLLPIFKEAPQKTLVLLDSSTDSANGMATFVPEPIIVAHTVLPDPISSIGDFDSWAEELMIHEYTHILNFQPVHGFYVPFKYIFGNVVRPNAVLPRWYMEGLAVEMETRLSDGGRLRSDYVHAAIRALVHENQLSKETLDQINPSSIPRWPFGSRPYFYGSLMWTEMARSNDPAIFEKINQHYSRRIPLFLLDEPALKITDKTYEQLRLSLYQRLTSDASEQIKSIQDKRSIPLVSMNLAGAGQHSPSVSPDGQWLVFPGFVPKQQGQLRLIKKENNLEGTPTFAHGKSEVVHRGYGFLRASWKPDSSGFVFDQLNTVNHYNSYRDLFFYDLKTKQVRRITKGLRAHEPAFSPEGDRLAFIKMGPNKSELALMSLPSRQTRIIYKPESGTRLSRPEFLDKNTVAFSKKSPGTPEMLYALDMNSGKIKSLLPTYRPAKMPRLTSSGLVFVSGQTGAENLFLSKFPYEKAQPLTNTLTQVTSGDLDTKTQTIYASELTSQGLKLKSKPLAIEHPPQLDPVVKPYWPEVSEKPLKSISMKKKDYSPLGYLLPKYWIPFIYPMEDGVLIQALTTGSDPAGVNSYTLNLGYDTVTQLPSYAVSFTNRSLPTSLYMSYVEYNDYFPSGALLTSRSGQVGAGFFLAENNQWIMNLGSISSQSGSFEGTPIERWGSLISVSYNDSTNSERPEGGYKDNHFLSRLEWLSYFYDGGPNFRTYNKTSGSLQYEWTRGLRPQHSIGWQLKGTFAPEIQTQDLVELGDKTSGVNYVASLINSSYLMRGYPSGAFIGKSLVNTSLSYSFPVFDIYQGRGLFPLFVNDLTASVFVDGISVDGAALSRPLGGGAYQRNQFDSSFWSTGLEMHLNMQAGFHLPISFVTGLYKGFDKNAYGDFSIFYGLVLGSLDGLGKSSTGHFTH
ncbi:MAG: PD40 domain-containing protein [Pseudobdellovibrionaceae bacterium]|nr:MAG: PD40 domain-containing protein [Pseudobdellovibrionaceae bacterium]